MERLNEIFKGQHIQRRRPLNEEGSTPSPVHPQTHPGLAPRRPLPEQTARLGDFSRAYQPGTPADVVEEWQGEWDEEESAAIRYGDWESDIYDSPPRKQGQESQPAPRLSAGRIAQSYPQAGRSFVTRELRPPLDEENAPLPAQNAPSPRQPTPYYLSSSPALPPSRPAGQPQRVTQPLNRPSAVARLGQTPPQHQQERQLERDPRRARLGQERRPDRQRRQLLSPDNHEQAPQLIPAPYINPKTPCPICKGKGYLRADVPYGHPNFGRPIACECKEKERRERRRLQLQEMSNLGELRDKRFDNFNVNVSRAVLEAYRSAREYAEEPEGWLVFIGRVGCGKTHLAAAIANQSLANGSRVLFSTVSDLLDHLRATFMPNATEVYDHLFQEMREAELLVLDDLGAQQSSPWANEKLFQLLNYRYNSRFPTIITTNNTGLQGIEERIRSRIMDVSLVTTINFDQTGDYRLRNPRRE